VFPIVPHHPREPSPRAKDLGRRLADAIREFERSYPKTSPEDLRDALRMAAEQAGHPPQTRSPRLVMALAATAAALGVGLVVSQGSSAREPVPWIPILLVAAAVIAVSVVSRRRD
jgi:hypothetical protein